jgi:hypothetical protein
MTFQLVAGEREMGGWQKTMQLLQFSLAQNMTKKNLIYPVRMLTPCKDRGAKAGFLEHLKQKVAIMHLLGMPL